MSKEVRIYCADLLTQIEDCVPTATIVQMMQKESMFKQKFCQILPGGGGSSIDRINNVPSQQPQVAPTTGFGALKTPSLSSLKPPGLSVITGKSSVGSLPSSLSKLGMKDGIAPAQKSETPVSAPAGELSPVVTGILLLMLEDDSMAVRLAGIRAMSCFGRACGEIRSKCLHFLIDMLNDEINEVRIGALHGISRFNKVLTLNDYEVEIVLFNLSEDNPRLREEIYLFFAETTV